MRLINTDGPKEHLLEKYVDPRNVLKPYAILSHTWVREPNKELEFNDIRDAGDNDAKAAKARSAPKVSKTCELAKSRNISLAWIDTICIDQNSSSDKSEAINAMYRYYQGAEVCFTYLSDVDGYGEALKDPKPDQPDTADMKALRERFSAARWFKRGWTLQELLAPPEILFFDKKWKLLGSRSELCNTIAKITRIDPQVLQDSKQIWSHSIAQRMSWAAGRETRRPEDKAYSLLGIFGVNMPMLYGEGDRAFTRLQEEIIRISDDHSLFAWSRFGDQDDSGQEGSDRKDSGQDDPDHNSSDQDNFALLARTPDEFAGCANITYIPNRTENYPYSVNNRGIAIRLRLIPWSVDVYLAPINCLRQPKPQGSGGQQRKPLQLGIFLKREREHDKFFRVSLDRKDLHEFPSKTTFDPWQRKMWYHENMKNVQSEFRYDHTLNWKTSTEWNPVPLQAKRDPWSPDGPIPGAFLQTINGFRIGPNLLKEFEASWITREPSPDPPSQRNILERTTASLKGLMGRPVDSRGCKPQWNAAQQIVWFPEGCVPALRLEPKGFDGTVLASFDDSYNPVLETIRPETSCYDGEKNFLGTTRRPRGAGLAGVLSAAGLTLKVEVDRLDRYKVLNFVKTNDPTSFQFRLKRKSLSKRISDVWEIDLKSRNASEEPLG